MKKENFVILPGRKNPTICDVTDVCVLVSADF